MKSVLMKAITRAAAPMLLVSLTSCSHQGLLDTAGPVAAGERTILLNSLVIMLAIVVPTIVATLGFAFWYRADRPRGRYLPDWAYSGRVELVVWAIPILVIMFLGGVIWIGSYQLDPFKPLPSKAKPIEVQVVALDWKWLFIYPEEQIATVNQLTIPAGVPVHFSITSASVFNTFFIPQLGSMIYAMPGMTSQLNLQADHLAVLMGESGHFSGDGFSDMNFQVHSVSPQDYSDWVKRTRGTGQALDRQSYASLAHQSHNVKPFTYGGADPMLFNDIVTQKIGPAPGPEPESPAQAGQEKANAGSL